MSRYQGNFDGVWGILLELPSVCGRGVTIGRGIGGWIPKDILVKTTTILTLQINKSVNSMFINKDVMYYCDQQRVVGKLWEWKSG